MPSSFSVDLLQLLSYVAPPCLPSFFTLRFFLSSSINAVAKLCGNIEMCRLTEQVSQILSSQRIREDVQNARRGVFAALGRP